MTRRLGLLAVAALMVSCAAYLTRTRDYYSGDLIKIPHARHAAAKVECIVCHEGAWDSTAIGEGEFRPKEAKCLECHADVKTKGNCASCHTDVKLAGPFPKREHTIKINHKAHIELVKEDCATCHTVLPEPVRTRQLTPTMKSCTNCHVHQKDFNEGRCNLCHTDLARYPLKPISAFTHQGNYVKNHSGDARSSVDTCANCHEHTFCADCHASTVSTRVETKYSERVESDFIHRNDFLSRHSIEARADETQCARCHGKSFCVNCHSEQNLAPGSQNPRNPHPAGWAIPGSPNNHGIAARMDVSSCAACHDQGARSNCVDCHKVGGIGGNPHPPGWTDKHSGGEVRTNGMCLFCHG